MENRKEQRTFRRGRRGGGASDLSSLGGPRDRRGHWRKDD